MRNVGFCPTTSGLGISSSMHAVARLDALMHAYCRKRERKGDFLPS